MDFLVNIFLSSVELYNPTTSTFTSMAATAASSLLTLDLRKRKIEEKRER